ncbi:hypothetical protein HMPREF9946_03593 [Acetobacteraceae bacterium AT-5844]|nr:hypothetical protein HMPREF9946_03593 [Acetobacteraceae bacterium AT-5844]
MPLPKAKAGFANPALSGFRSRRQACRHDGAIILLDWRSPRYPLWLDLRKAPSDKVLAPFRSPLQQRQPAWPWPNSSAHRSEMGPACLFRRLLTLGNELLWRGLTCFICSSRPEGFVAPLPFHKPGSGLSLRCPGECPIDPTPHDASRPGAPLASPWPWPASRCHRPAGSPRGGPAGRTVYRPFD